MMKKVCILAAICFVLTFTACAERSDLIFDPNEQNSASQSEASGKDRNAAYQPQSTQPENSSAESDIIPENSEEHFIFCFGNYDEETNAVEIYGFSTDNDIISIYESTADDEWNKIADISYEDSYNYKITEDFKEKKIKAIRETANGRLESIPFSIVFRDGSYICEMPDSDNDKVDDFDEKINDTDPNDPDTDGDGFSDYEEIKILHTDPLVKNEDGDLDGDGLSDKKELELGTDPWHADTDSDGLSDFDEINKYKTDPLNPDTDGDTLKDKYEILIGLDPNNATTHGVPDAEYAIYGAVALECMTKQIIGADSDPLKAINKKSSPFTLSLEITASGDVNSWLVARKSDYAAVIQSDNQIGEAVELKYKRGKIDEVVLHFQIADEYVQNELNYYPDHPELHGVKRFNIFKYFEDLNMLLPIETVVDTQTNTITSTVDELGTYCVIDMEKWFKNLEDFGSLQSG